MMLGLGVLIGAAAVAYLGVGFVCYLAMLCLDPHNTNITGLHVVVTWPFMCIYYLIKAAMDKRNV